MLRNNEEFKGHYESADGMTIFGTPILEFTKRELAAFIGWQDKRYREDDEMRLQENLREFENLAVTRRGK